jgi:hypothetical protein
MLFWTISLRPEMSLHQPEPKPMARAEFLQKGS